MSTVRLAHCRIEYEPGASLRTVFNDGAEWGAFPHSADAHYHVIAHRCGYGDDLWRYCFEHEVVHSFLHAEGFIGGPGVIWRLAHGLTEYPLAAAVEEAMAHTFQRWLRANERPIIGGVDWDDLKARCLALLP
jgi:hypothetical protein